MSSAVRPPLAVVVPMANEEATIDVFLDGVLAHLQPGDQLIAVFDGACRDGTSDLVRARAEDEPRLRWVYDETSRSPVDAYLRGYREALAGDFGWVVEMDAGMSHDPAQLPRFTDALARGVDFAAGSRFLADGSYEGGSRLHKWLFSQGGTWLANLLLRTRYSDLVSGFKGYTRAALEEVMRVGIRSRAHTFQIEVRVILADWRWEEIPIDYGGASHRIGLALLWDCVRNLIRLWLAPRSRPGRS